MMTFSIDLLLGSCGPLCSEGRLFPTRRVFASHSRCPVQKCQALARKISNSEYDSTQSRLCSFARPGSADLAGSAIQALTAGSADPAGAIRNSYEPNSELLPEDKESEAHTSLPFNKAYSRLSARACQLASMMLVELPTVLQARRPSLESISTRVCAAVPAPPSRMRTL